MVRCFGNSIHPPMEWIEPVLERYERPLLQYASSLCGNGEAARDVVQETFLRLARQGAMAPERLAPWLYTVCRNYAVDMKRKESKVVSMPTPLEEMMADEPGPAAVAQQKEAAARLTNLLSQLPELQQEVLRLRFQGDLSYREIAEVTRLEVNYVGVLIHNGLKKLRQLWPESSETRA